MSQNNWEADKMLDAYIHDYMMKRKLHASAKEFQAEAKVPTLPVAIDAPGGFLFEWWSVFWDMFMARTNEMHSEAAASYIEAQLAQFQGLQPHQQQHHLKPPQHQQMQMQQLLLQRHAQQQRHNICENQHPNGTPSGLGDRLKLPLERDSLDDAAMKLTLSDNVGQLLDPNHASLLKASALGGHCPGQTLHGMPGGSGNLQQLPVSTLDIKRDRNSMTNPRTTGSYQGGNNLTLKGWPLTGLNQLELLQHQRLMQLSQPLRKYQLQQQLLLQAQQKVMSPSVNDLERRKLRMLLNNQNVGLGIPMQVGQSVVPCGDIDMLVKNNNQQQQQYPQHTLSSQQSQNSNHHLQQQDITLDETMSNTFQGNGQASKSQTGRKRKEPGSSLGPANSSGTTNTTAQSPSSPLMPSTNTSGDAVVMPSLPCDSSSSKAMLTFGSGGLGSLASAPNELANMDCFVDDRPLEDNVDSFFSQDAADPRDQVGQSMYVRKGYTFSEIQLLHASTSKAECCGFSSDGKLLATGGHDKKATLWCTESFTVKSTLEEHSQWITDVCFSPSGTQLATASADKTVRVWDADNPDYSLRTFTGHSKTVMSVDFHPSKEDLICSCDNNSEMRYWSIKNGSCAGVFKGGATNMRFQPHLGRILAAAADNLVSILDVETQVCRFRLQGHKSAVHSVCWDPSGDRLASVSDDLVRVWTIDSGSKGECTHELSCSGNKFHACVFHPTYPSLLVIGCYETLELWNTSENKTITLHAHDKLVSALAASNANGLVASASHDNCVKLWK